MVPSRPSPSTVSSPSVQGIRTARSLPLGMTKSPDDAVTQTSPFLAAITESMIDSGSTFGSGTRSTRPSWSRKRPTPVPSHMAPAVSVAHDHSGPLSHTSARVSSGMAHPCFVRTLAPTSPTPAPQTSRTIGAHREDVVADEALLDRVRDDGPLANPEQTAAHRPDPDGALAILEKDVDGRRHTTGRGEPRAVRFALESCKAVPCPDPRLPVTIDEDRPREIPDRRRIAAEPAPAAVLAPRHARRTKRHPHGVVGTEPQIHRVRPDEAVLLGDWPQRVTVPGEDAFATAEPPAAVGRACQSVDRPHVFRDGNETVTVDAIETAAGANPHPAFRVLLKVQMNRGRVPSASARLTVRSPTTWTTSPVRVPIHRLPSRAPKSAVIDSSGVREATAAQRRQTDGRRSGRDPIRCPPTASRPSSGRSTARDPAAGRRASSRIDDELGDGRARRDGRCLGWPQECPRDERTDCGGAAEDHEVRQGEDGTRRDSERPPAGSAHADQRPATVSDDGPKSKSRLRRLWPLVPRESRDGDWTAGGGSCLMMR